MGTSGRRCLHWNTIKRSLNRPLNMIGLRIGLRKEVERFLVFRKAGMHWTRVSRSNQVRPCRQRSGENSARIGRDAGVLLEVGFDGRYSRLS